MTDLEIVQQAVADKDPGMSVEDQPAAGIVVTDGVHHCRVVVEDGEEPREEILQARARLAVETVRKMRWVAEGRP